MVYGLGVLIVYVSRYVNEILIKVEEEVRKFKDEYISVEYVYLVMIDLDIFFFKSIFRKYGIICEKFL